MDSSDQKPPRSSEWKARRSDLSEQIRSTREDIERQVRDGREKFDQVNERIEARTGRNLVFAIAIGVVLGAALLLSLIFVKVLFALFATVLVFFTTFELVHAFKRVGRTVDAVPALASALVIIGTSYFADAPTRGMVLAAGIAFVVVWRLVAEMLSAENRPARAVVSDLATGAFIQLYVPWFASFAVALVGQDDGEWWALAFMILVVAVDIGAYATGLTFGKHPMAPKISPKKTWEGFIGAAFCSVVAGVLLALFMIDVPWWLGIVIAVLILLTATLGDLAESMIKRDMGVKDMSSWLPGHGGFLDRLDSLLPSAAVMFGIYTVVVM